MKKILKISAMSIVLSAIIGSGFYAVGEPTDDLSNIKILTDDEDQSRQQLFSLVKAAEEQEDKDLASESIQLFNLYGPFRFPNDTTWDPVAGHERKNSIFGIDISHHQKPDVPIKDLARKHVKFVYMKATQGTGYRDSKFPEYWIQAGENKLHRGAYHFLSSTTNGADQATTFLRVIKANGGLKETDMPPVVDLEWDMSSGVDQWASKSSAEIISSAKAWLIAVENETHRKPMIYTARSWIRGRPGLEDKMKELGDAGYTIWAADYSKSSRGTEKPNTPKHLKTLLWQFTDSATLAAGYNGSFDANIFQGSDEEFYNSFGLKRF